MDANLTAPGSLGTLAQPQSAAPPAAVVIPAPPAASAVTVEETNTTPSTLVILSVHAALTVLNAMLALGNVRKGQEIRGSFRDAGDLIACKNGPDYCNYERFQEMTTFHTLEVLGDLVVVLLILGVSIYVAKEEMRQPTVNQHTLTFLTMTIGITGFLFPLALITMAMSIPTLNALQTAGFPPQDAALLDRASNLKLAKGSLLVFALLPIALLNAVMLFLQAVLAIHHPNNQQDYSVRLLWERYRPSPALVTEETDSLLQPTGLADADAATDGDAAQRLGGHRM